MVPNILLAKTKDQKRVVKYFTGGGCLGSLTKMKDNEYDNMIQARVASLNSKKRALDKIGLDEDQLKEVPPVYFQGFESDSDSFAKECSDGRIRTSKYSVTWLFFSNTQVYMYHHAFDMISEWKKEETQEYFYKDIVNFSTSSESIQVLSKTGCFGGTPGTTMRDLNHFALIVPGDRFSCSTSQSDSVDASVSAMKQKLREKKGN